MGTENEQVEQAGSTGDRMEIVRQAILDAQPRRDTPLNGGFGLDIDDYSPPTVTTTPDEIQRLGSRITHGISYAGESDETIFVPQQRSEAMTTFNNDRPA